MHSPTKVLLSLSVLWIIFCGIVYIGVHHYFLADLLRVGNVDGQEVLLNRYPFTQIINHYFIVFVFMMLFLGILVWRVLRGIDKNHTEMLLRFHHTIAEQVKNQDELNKKNDFLKKRAEKADLIDGKFHTLCDHLNSINTSLMLVREKVLNASSEKVLAEEKDFLIKELDLLNSHFKGVDEVIKSMSL